MKRYGRLWERVITWDNLACAARKARRGKRSRPEVQRFEFDLERELLLLQAELRTGQFVPGGFRTHWVQCPKPRLISAARACSAFWGAKQPNSRPRRSLLAGERDFQASRA